MFDSVRKYQRVMLGLVLLLILPAFVFFGVSGYDQMIGGGDEIAVVDGTKIPRQAFEEAHRQQVERLQQMLGGQVDVKLFDTPAARAQTLEGLITQQAMLAQARSRHIAVSPTDVQKAILGIEGLVGEDGKFDFERYRTLLAQQNMTPAMFEARIAQDLTLQQLGNSVQNSVIVPKTVVDHIFQLQESQRTVRTRLIDAKDFEGGIEPTDEQLAKYYEENASAFQVAESVDVEYVLLDRNRLAAAAKATDEELKAFYEKNKAQFTDPEQRRASHVLIAAGADADAAAKAQAKEKAQKLLAELKSAPEKFDELAKANSDDTGSAAQGGDLGFFSRDMMVAPFSEAAFAMKEGEISDLVQSEYGFHIIKVTGAKGSGEKPFEEARPELEALYRQQQAATRYTELADSFTNTVYEQSDSLQPAVSKFSLELKKAEGVTRNPGPAVPPDSPLRNPRLLGLLFGEDTLRNKRNTDWVITCRAAWAGIRPSCSGSISSRPCWAIISPVVRSMWTITSTSSSVCLSTDRRMASSIPPKMMSLEMFFSRCIVSTRLRTAWRCVSLRGLLVNGGLFLALLRFCRRLGHRSNPVLRAHSIPSFRIEPVQSIRPEPDRYPSIQQACAEATNFGFRATSR